MNLANRISITRIILVPFFISAVVYSRFTAALVIFMVCVVSDALDGYIARTRNMRTHLGAFLDPAADKLLLISAFISLSIINNLPEALRFPAYVPLVIVSRDALIILGCLVIYLFKGKVDIKPSIPGKMTTFLQMMSVIAVLANFPHSIFLWNAAVVMTVISGLDYLKRANRILNENR